MSRRWVGLMLWVSLVAGCGGTGGLFTESTPEWSPSVVEAPAVGRVELRQQEAKAQRLPMEVARVRLTAQDADGYLVWGPFEQDWQVEALLEHVPVSAETLTVEALSAEDGSVAGRAEMAMVVREGQTARLADPTFEVVPPRFASLRITPGSAPLAPGQSTHLKAIGAYSDGTEVDLTQRVQWTSSAPHRLRVGNSPGQRGRAVSLDDIQGDVSVSARFLTDQVLVGQLGLDQGTLSSIDPAEGAIQSFGGALASRTGLTTLDLDGDGQEEIAHSDGQQVRCVDLAGLERWSFEPWDTLAGSTLHLSSDDLDGDGQEDLVVAGLRYDGRPQVLAFDGSTLTQSVPRVLFALGGLSANFINGVQVATGQDGDGTPALVLGAGPERSPEVRVYRLVRDQERLQPVLIRKFLAFDASQRGGARVALGDLDADGLLELLTATGAGELPRLRASLLHTGQQLWMANLGNAPSLDGVSLASGQLYGSFGDDVAACVTYRSPDEKGSVFVLDGPSGRKVRAYEAASGHRAILAAGNISSAGLSASADLRLTTARPSRLEFSPSMTRLDAGDPQAQLKVRARFSDGQTLDVTDLASFALGSGDREAVLLETNGKVTALGRGAVATQAYYAGLTAIGSLDSAAEPTLKTLSITPVNGSAEVAGREIPFRATGCLENGLLVDLTERVAWSSEAESVLTLLNMPGRRGVGLVVGEGTSLVQASDPILGVAASMPFTAVPPRDIVGLSVEPRSFLLGRQERQRLKLLARYEDGSVRPLTSGVKWRSSDPSVSIDGSGEVTSGERAASAVLTGTVKGVDGSATARVQVDVPAPRLVSLAPLPGDLTLRPDQSLQLGLETHYDRGDIGNSSHGVSFSSSDPATVTVTPTGLVRAGGIDGMAEIVVQHVSGVRSIIPVRVQALSPSLLALDVNLDASTVADGVSTSAVATGSFSTGPARNLTGAVVWTSSNPSVATVSPTGAITAAAPGVAVLRATHATGVYGEAPLTVTQAQLLSASIQPKNPSFESGERALMILYGSFTNGEVRALSQGVNWASLSPSVFGFPSAGVGTAVAANPGLATVIASAGKVTASLTVRVLE